MVRILRCASLFVAALVLAPVYAHLLEVPGRRALDGPTWLAVQHTFYGGYAISGALFEPLALVLCLVTAWRLRGARAALATHLLAAACVAGMLLVFALGNNPINGQFAAWTPATLTPDWAALRDRWEVYHAASAALATVAFLALLLATARDLRGPAGGATVGERRDVAAPSGGARRQRRTGLGV